MITLGEKVVLAVTTVFACVLGTLAYQQSQQAPQVEPAPTYEIAQELVIPDTDPVNLNTASVEELSTLPSIGEVLAQRIVDYRTEFGSFETIEDVCNVSGIGESKLESITPFAVLTD